MFATLRKNKWLQKLVNNKNTKIAQQLGSQLGTIWARCEFFIFIKLIFR